VGGAPPSGRARKKRTRETNGAPVGVRASRAEPSGSACGWPALLPEWRAAPRPADRHWQTNDGCSQLEPASHPDLLTGLLALIGPANEPNLCSMARREGMQFTIASPGSRRHMIQFGLRKPWQACQARACRSLAPKPARLGEHPMKPDATTERPRPAPPCAARSLALGPLEQVGRQSWCWHDAMSLMSTAANLSRGSN